MWEKLLVAAAATFVLYLFLQISNNRQKTSGSWNSSLPKLVQIVSNPKTFSQRFMNMISQ